MPLGKQRPIPRRGQYLDDAAGRAHQQARRDERSQYDCERQLARNVNGSTITGVAAGSSVKMFHTLGRPIDGCHIQLISAATVAGPLYELEGSNDGKSITIVNDNAQAVTMRVEVY